MTVRRFARGGAALALLALPALAAAQPAPEPTRGGTLSVERMQSGFVLVPDNRFTEVDGEFANLFGGWAGFLTDDTLAIGAGGYWLTNGSRDRELGYGGLVAEWTFARSERLGASVRALIGGGSGTLGEDAVFVPRPPRHPFFDERSDQDDDRGLSGEPVTRRVLVREGFFVAEPQLNLQLRLARSLRLDLGVGYRFLGGVGRLDERLRGVSGTVSLRIGAF